MEFKYHSDYTGENECRLVIENGVPFITFTAFEPYEYIICGFSTREGGVSEEHLSSMNLSYSRGDRPERVDENYERICKALGISREQLIFTDQVHSKTVAYVDGSKGKYMETDGLITDCENLILTTSYADCVPLFFVDTHKKKIGTAHSGWRGTVAKIGQEILCAMKQQFETRPEDVVAVIGPSICRDCYEVSDEVINEVKKILSPEQVEQVVVTGSDDHFHLDLWKTNQYILENAGVPSSQIHIAGLCTSCNHKYLFSHRASKGNRGNLSGFLGIKDFSFWT